MTEQHLPLTVSLSGGDEPWPGDLVGGKARSLQLARAAGLPVPDGHCLTTAAYRRFVAEAGLDDVIDFATSLRYR